jgi:hypothetical protein
MSVDVKTGSALIPGTENPHGAVYSVFSDSDKNVSIAASNPSLPRIDLIVLKVQDSQYSGATNAWSIVVVTGVAASSPAVPTAPANSLILAQIAVGAGVTSITNGNITDRRPWLTAAGGITVVRSLAERDALVAPYDGTIVLRTDANDALNVWDTSGWQWHARPVGNQIAALQATTSTAYTDLATVGPTVTLECGSAIKVYLTAGIAASIQFEARMSFSITGATNVGANDANSIYRPDALLGRVSATFFLTGLTSGVHTITAKYRSDTAGSTASFIDRQIIVEAC